jgi:hypothetical protein
MSDAPKSGTSLVRRPLRAFDARINGWAREITGFQGLFIGAITVAVGQTVVEWLPLSDFYSALALFPITLVLLSVQLFLAARFADTTASGC